MNTKEAEPDSALPTITRMRCWERSATQRESITIENATGIRLSIAEWLRITPGTTPRDSMKNCITGCKTNEKAPGAGRFLFRKNILTGLAKGVTLKISKSQF